ncbi:hypothetical protein QE152_g25933 [Popillia japonica]|uniref:Uncharacterized protein n=1 Tax=Popillia japonica TaxID=7064 RepID=A0AAW1JYE5_POPJA
MASQRLVCHPIKNYNDSKLIDLLDESFSFKDAVGVDVIALNELQEDIKVPVGAEILSPEDKAKLTELADSNISNINFDRFTTVLEDNLTKVDLNYLVKQLDAVLETVNRRMVPEEIKANLQNGLWFVLFWSLLVFTITIILSVKLASLYKKFEYSFAGESNGKANKKKKKNKRQDGRSPNFPPERAGDHREFPSGSNQENRYADMAPKQQWEDFPHGGPPQYQRAPTEYERPPPYYYPGNR